MLDVPDLSKLAEPPAATNYVNPNSLLNKYQIPINHLDFRYVENCTNGSELEKILKILRSGEEGHYPELMEVTEKRLEIFKPRSKLLETITPVLQKGDLNKTDLDEITEDLDKWLTSVSRNSKQLESKGAKVSNNIPVEIRKYQEIISEENESKPEKRIASTDYATWDKYDPDTELLKMDLSEEAQKKRTLEEQKNPTITKPKKSVSFNRFATEAEAQFMSDREREKGNEFFRAGDYQEALQSYTNSITSKTSVTNLNNRAITYIKLKRYAPALDDCEKALVIEPENLKSVLRKALALEGLGRFSEALEWVLRVIERDPNNQTAQGLAERVRKYCGDDLTNTRLKIVEID